MEDADEYYQELLAELRQLSYHASRFPLLDALEGFVPDGEANEPAVQQALSLTGQSRWYPVDGGHRVLALYEGGDYDASRFRVVEGAWDHENCTYCGVQIPTMTLCFVSWGPRYAVLCRECYASVTGNDPDAVD